MTVKNPCPICGKERKRDSSRHLLATCGSHDCARESSSRKQAGVSKLPDQFRRTIAYHACADAAAASGDDRHYGCCPTPDVPVVECDWFHNAYDREGPPPGESYDEKLDAELAKLGKARADVRYQRPMTLEEHAFWGPRIDAEGVPALAELKVALAIDDIDEWTQAALQRTKESA
jgi:hypothetical protein